MLEAEVFTSASGEYILPMVGTGSTPVSATDTEPPSDVSNARKVYAAESVANTAQLVAVPDQTINARKICTAVVAGTGNTID